MPALEDVRGLLNPTGDRSLDAAIEKLVAGGVRTDRDVLLANDKELAAKCGCGTDTMAILRERLGEAHLAPLRSARELLEHRTKDANGSALGTWSFGSDGIDTLLDGGIHSGDIIELSGTSSQGKTQLCLFATLSAIVGSHHALTTMTSSARTSLGTALYVDTANAFSPHRVLELFNGSDRFAEARKAGVNNEDVLSRIRVTSCFDAYSLLRVLYDVDSALSRKSTTFYCKFQILIIDSVATILSPILGMKQTTGLAIMASIGRLLRTIAASHGVAVVVVNHAVSARQEGIVAGTKPALGTTWSSVPSVRLFLRHDTSDDADEQNREGMVWTFEAADGTVMRLVKRMLEVRNSTRTNVGAHAAVYIGTMEIICE